MEETARKFRDYQQSIRKELMKIRTSLKDTTLAYIVKNGGYTTYEVNEEWWIVALSFSIDDSDKQDITLYSSDMIDDIIDMYQGYTFVRGNISFVYNPLQHTINVFFFMPKEDVDRLANFSDELVPDTIPLIDKEDILDGLTESRYVYVAIDEIVIDINNYMTDNEKNPDVISIAKTLAVQFSKLGIQDIIFRPKDIITSPELLVEYIDGNSICILDHEVEIRAQGNYYTIYKGTKKWQVNLLTLLYVLERL